MLVALEALRLLALLSLLLPGVFRGPLVYDIGVICRLAAVAGQVGGRRSSHHTILPLPG